MRAFDPFDLVKTYDIIYFYDSSNSECLKL